MAGKFEFNDEKKDILVQSLTISKMLDVSQKQISNYIDKGMPFVMVTEKQKGFFVRECLDWFNLNVKKQKYLNDKEILIENQVKNSNFQNIALNEYEDNKIKKIFDDLVYELKPTGILQLALVRDLATIQIKKERIEKYKNDKIKKDFFSISNAVEFYINKNENLKKTKYKNLVLNTAIDIYKLHKQNKPMYGLDFISDDRFNEKYDFLTTEYKSSDIIALSDYIQSLDNPNIETILKNIEIFKNNSSDKNNIEIYDSIAMFYQDFFSILPHTFNFKIINITEFVNDFKSVLFELHDNKNFIDSIDNRNNEIINKPDPNYLLDIEFTLFNYQSKIIKEFKELKKL
jgi:hypothetical protein